MNVLNSRLVLLPRRILPIHTALQNARSLPNSFQTLQLKAPVLGVLVREYLEFRAGSVITQMGELQIVGRLVFPIDFIQLLLSVPQIGVVGSLVLLSLIDEVGEAVFCLDRKSDVLR